MSDSGLRCLSESDERFDNGKQDDKSRCCPHPAEDATRARLHVSQLGLDRVDKARQANNTPSMGARENTSAPTPISSTSPSPNILDMPPEIVEMILTHLYFTDVHCGVGWTLYAKITTLKAAIPLWDENVRHTYRKCIGI